MDRGKDDSDEHGSMGTAHHGTSPCRSIVLGTQTVPEWIPMLRQWSGLLRSNADPATRRVAARMMNRVLPDDGDIDPTSGPREPNRHGDRSAANPEVRHGVPPTAPPKVLVKPPDFGGWATSGRH